MIFPTKPNTNEKAIISNLADFAINHNSLISVFLYIAQIINKPMNKDNKIFARLFRNLEFIPMKYYF